MHEVQGIGRVVPGYTRAGSHSTLYKFKHEISPRVLCSPSLQWLVIKFFSCSGWALYSPFYRRKTLLT
jgi:hypothetical protein